MGIAKDSLIKPLNRDRVYGEAMELDEALASSTTLKICKATIKSSPPVSLFIPASDLSPKLLSFLQAQDSRDYLVGQHSKAIRWHSEQKVLEVFIYGPECKYLTLNEYLDNLLNT